ncbi:hypothetical protein 2A_00067 [Ralstonia phage Darius]|uniref:Uncharacterized protein n=2 Tax=Gervaisevirus gervaise TaxID=2846047 RepID=A0A7G5BAH2_9CAUD|nr:hypothetical protein KMC51_gp62 [Ralstonia phage Gervaise]QMV32819.1 hypothetical protein 2A_00067 [Ralstonia phage Darius]QMV33295.1 hypothetical protein 1Ca_00058 [Ralstonia phage Gervaise]
MDHTNNGGPAFPFVEPNNECNVATGITARDYFAAKALEGLIASYASFQGDPLDPRFIDGNAKRCYAMADAMIRAREAA